MKINLAGCVITNTEGKVLLIHRSTPKRTQWELPGGKIEENEVPENAAIRELQEELGIKVEIVKKLGEKSFMEDAFTMDYIWFQAKIISGEPKLQEDKFNILNYFSWDELRGKKDLSANAGNLVNAYFQKVIVLS